MLIASKPFIIYQCRFGVGIGIAVFALVQICLVFNFLSANINIIIYTFKEIKTLFQGEA